MNVINCRVGRHMWQKDCFTHIILVGTTVFFNPTLNTAFLDKMLTKG